jgi:hypothetical protein
MPSWPPPAALCTALVLAAGCEEGRAPDTCPEHERCSARTPRGLIFVGAPLSDGSSDELAAVAVGGFQTIRLKLPADDAAPPLAFAEDVEAKVEAPFQLGAVEPPAIELWADGPGERLLRILEPDGELLLDRVAVRAESVSDAELLPREHPDEPAWAIYASGDAELVARLSGESGARLVDEGLALSSDGAAVERRAWDLFHVSGIAHAELEFELESSAGEVFTQLVRVTDSLHRIELALADAGTAGHFFLGPGDEEIVCFAGRTEDGAAVAGLDWTYEALGPIEAVSWRELPRCAVVRGLEPGPAGLYVRAAGLELGFAIDVIGDADPLPGP